MNDSAMRLCFILEDRYRFDGMPSAVARQLADWGHDIELLEPQHSVTAISEVLDEGARFDAYVLKTVSNGPGLSILEAAAAAGHVTINPAQSVHMTRDKAIAVAIARRHGLPVPLTYFAAKHDLVSLVPQSLYPIVVKPAHGSSCESIYLVETPEALAALAELGDDERFFLVQPYAKNPGVDVKLYCIDGEVFATHQRSPLHPTCCDEPSLVRLDPELEGLALAVGHAFNLDLYGVDVVDTPSGWVVLDVNDFPSFTCVPDAAARVARGVLRIADRGRRDLAPDLIDLTATPSSLVPVERSGQLGSVEVA